MAKKNKSYTNKDIEKFLTEKIKRSGFSLENSVDKILREENFSVLREYPYYDFEENKSRTIDIISNTYIPDLKKIPKNKVRHIGQLTLIVECKNIPGNVWIFTKKEHDGISLPDLNSITSEIPKDPANQFSPSWPVKEMAYAEGYDEYVFNPSQSNKLKGNPTNLFSAIMAVSKATYDHNKNQEKMFKKLRYFSATHQNFFIHFQFVQPVIVFSGPIYLVKQEKNIKLERTDFVQIPNTHTIKGEHTSAGELHIVSFDSFSKYLKIVEKYYRFAENKILEKSDELKKAKDSLRGL